MYHFFLSILFLTRTSLRRTQYATGFSKRQQRRRSRRFSLLSGKRKKKKLLWLVLLPQQRKAQRQPLAASVGPRGPEKDSAHPRALLKCLREKKNEKRYSFTGKIHNPEAARPTRTSGRQIRGFRQTGSKSLLENLASNFLLD